MSGRGAKAEELKWLVAGVERLAWVERPAKTAEGPAALSLRLHEVWPQACMVYPQSVPTPGMLSDPEGKWLG